MESGSPQSAGVGPALLLTAVAVTLRPLQGQLMAAQLPMLHAMADHLQCMELGRPSSPGLVATLLLKPVAVTTGYFHFQLVAARVPVLHATNGNLLVSMHEVRLVVPWPMPSMPGGRFVMIIRVAVGCCLAAQVIRLPNFLCFVP